MVEHKIMDMRATSSKQNKVFIIGIIYKKLSYRRHQIRR